MIKLRKIALLKAYYTYTDSDKEDDKKIMEEAERKDKSKSLEDVVNLSQKTQEKIKDMSLDEIIKYKSLGQLIDELY